MTIWGESHNSPRFAHSCFVALVAVATPLLCRAMVQTKPQLTAETLEAEQRLNELGYWTGPIDGKLDPATRYALSAFQRIEGRKQTRDISPEEIKSIRAARPPEPRERGSMHVEIDLSRQVLFIVEPGVPTKILPVSTGNEKWFTEGGWTRRAITPEGRFAVYRKIDGRRISPLGILYYPNYIVGGIAIHGSNSVPASPASHGCIRIPLFAAREFNRLIPIGTPVVVYRTTPRIEPLP